MSFTPGFTVRLNPTRSYASCECWKARPAMSSGAARGKSVDPHEAHTSGTIRTRTTSAAQPHPRVLRTDEEDPDSFGAVGALGVLVGAVSSGIRGRYVSGGARRMGAATRQGVSRLYSLDLRSLPEGCLPVLRLREDLTVVTRLGTRAIIAQHRRPSTSATDQPTSHHRCRGVSGAGLGALGSGWWDDDAYEAELRRSARSHLPALRRCASARRDRPCWWRRRVGACRGGSGRSCRGRAAGGRPRRSSCRARP